MMVFSRLAFQHRASPDVVSPNAVFVVPIWVPAGDGQARRARVVGEIMVELAVARLAQRRKP